MGRKIQVCALSLVAAFGYTTSAFAQPAETTKAEASVGVAAAAEPAPAPAPAPADAAPAAPAAPAPTIVEPAPVVTPAAPPEEPPPTVFDPLKIESKNATLKLGLLLQPQYEALSAGSNSPPYGVVGDESHKGMSNNLFVRRTRLIVGGTLFKTFEYFFDTDTSNLFRGDVATNPDAMPVVNGNGQKGGNGIVVQDAFGTWKAYEDAFKIDVGYMLTPGAHNALQGAGTLYGLDYFANSFIHSTLFNSNVNPAGRDAGLQFRGLVLDNHLEYRLGIFQGKRNAGTADQVAGQNMFRLAGRVQVNILDAETGFFYAGSYLGKKRILSVGAAYDFQDDYKHWAVDGFLDMPLGPGGLTAQVNVGGWKGGDFTTPPLTDSVTAIMAEAGYRFDAIPISPIVKFEQLSGTIATADVTQTRIGGGLAYWPFGHTINVKGFFTHASTKVEGTDAVGQDQFQLQTQLYFY
ncbi:MAG TPA: hypothetical protein VER12_02125 [Polyangiaceae bacterium]|nr:hypothetical protein [Polyangiaceae bacterium]